MQQTRYAMQGLEDKTATEADRVARQEVCNLAAACHTMMEAYKVDHPQYVHTTLLMYETTIVPQS